MKENNMDMITSYTLLKICKNIFRKTEIGKESIQDFMKERVFWKENIQFWEQSFWKVVSKEWKLKFKNMIIVNTEVLSKKEFSWLKQFILDYISWMHSWNTAKQSLESFLNSIFEILSVEKSQKEEIFVNTFNLIFFIFSILDILVFNFFYFPF